MERKQVLSRLFRGNTQTLKQLHREHYLLNLHLKRLVNNAARPLFIILFRDLYRVVNKIFLKIIKKQLVKNTAVLIYILCFLKYLVWSNSCDLWLRGSPK